MTPTERTTLITRLDALIAAVGRAPYLQADRALAALEQLEADWDATEQDPPVTIGVIRTYLEQAEPQMARDLAVDYRRRLLDRAAAHQARQSAPEGRP